MVYNSFPPSLSPASLLLPSSLSLYSPSRSFSLNKLRHIVCRWQSGKDARAILSPFPLSHLYPGETRRETEGAKEIQNIAGRKEVRPSLPLNTRTQSTRVSPRESESGAKSRLSILRLTKRREHTLPTNRPH